MSFPDNTANDEQIAGPLVSFTCLDAGKSSNGDFQFRAHCQFLPRRGERLEHQERNMVVIRVYYKVVDASLGNPVSVPNVVCRFIGSSDDTSDEVKKLLRSLEDDQQDD